MNNRSTGNKNAGAHGMTRRAAMAAGAAAATGFLSMSSSAMDQQQAGPSRSLRALYQDPLVTVDLSGVKAALSNGFSWTLDNIAPFKALLSELNTGYTRYIELISPEDGEDGLRGRPHQIKLDFGTSLLESGRVGGHDERGIPILTTALAAYKIAKEFGVLEFRDGKFAESDEAVLLNGVISFIYDALDVTNEKFREMEQEFERNEEKTYALNVSNLLGTPKITELEGEPEPTQTWGVPRFPIHNLNAALFNALPVHLVTSVTDDPEGLRVYRSEPLNVKNLLSFNPERLNQTKLAHQARSKYRGFSIAEAIDIIQIIPWDELVWERRAGDFRRVAGVSGSIGIGISIGF